MTERHTYAPHDRVDIVIRGAEVVVHGNGEISFGIDGLNQDLCILPVIDDDGQPLAAVTVTQTLPEVHAGDVWRARRSGCLYLGVATDYGKLLANAVGEMYHVATVIDQAGPLDLVLSENLGPVIDSGPDDRPAMYHLPDPESAAASDEPESTDAPAAAVPAESAPAGGHLPVYETLGPLGPANASDPNIGGLFSTYRAAQIEASAADTVLMPVVIDGEAAEREPEGAAT